MVEYGYFAEGGARAPCEETILEPEDDEAIVFKEFFSVGLRMPLHPVLAHILLVHILLKFQVQPRHLTPNAIAQLSKYFWVVTSFGSIHSTDGFTKRYELHYQPKKMKIDEAILDAQFGCLNFHAKWYKGNGARLNIVVKNKWSTGWTRACFTARSRCSGAFV
jgi:hypothetical protein